MDGRLREGPDAINAGQEPPPEPARVRIALDSIRPGLIADGGNVELVDVAEDGTVTVELQGACRTCPAARDTLQSVIAPRLERQLPGIRSVMAI